MRHTRHLTDEQCEHAVREALDSLPAEFRERLGDVAILIRDSHPDGLMGVYDPIGGVKRIVIFRDGNPTEEEVRKTVLHEVGHFFGMGEDQVRGLGY